MHRSRAGPSVVQTVRTARTARTHQYTTGMVGTVPIPVDGTVVTCPQCLASNDKGYAIDTLVAKLEPAESKGALLAYCVACHMPLMLIIGQSNQVEASASDVYYLAGEDLAAREPLPAARGRALHSVEELLRSTRGVP
jgi:hypothetical protein